ncbi:MAG TPA: LLM class flavin-dependent oxidoreductase [Stellaceae bacterium]|jgi:alkanesulfonate monooxygenase SsuD/methylene tetrahydromethanopterin reductase-like flavin-dependent oxidoreductase (luciferase family)|nr:LLM class flavin-dependent oxidoreductase [Stellaceae bacterium]
MKFTWFDLMPWPDLPADFREKHRSVWVDIDSTLFDPARSHTLYNTYMDLLEYAATLGFDGIGVNEHHQNGYGLMPSPNLIAATLARRTQDVALVVLGNSIALYNPPVRVAEEFAMLDCISGGRLVAGFPVGTSMDTNYCYGQIPALTREKYLEAHDLIMRAWRSREPFAFNGRYNKLRHVNIWPYPIQLPHPPVHIPGGGSVETYDFCIDNTYSYSYLSFTGYIRARALMSGYWDRVAERNAPDTSPYRAGFAQTICVAETDEEAERLYGAHVNYFYNRCLHVYPGFADAPGYRTIKTIQSGALSQYAPAGALFSKLTWKDMIEGGHIIAGSPETVRQRMEELIKSLHVGHIFCLLHIGDMPAEKAMYSSKLFAEKVMPKLRGLHPELAGDDRFWCKPLARRVTPGSLPRAADLAALATR